MTQPIVVAALYKFVTLEDYVALREPLLQAMVDSSVGVITALIPRIGYLHATLSFACQSGGDFWYAACE